jgi:hypothetical protein
VVLLSLLRLLRLLWLLWLRLSLRVCGRCAGDRLGWGSALRLAIRRNPAWTAGFRGFRSFYGHRALAVLAALEFIQGGPETSTRVAWVAPAIGTPAQPVARAPWRVEKNSRHF